MSTATTGRPADPVTIERRDGVAWCTIGTGGKRNALATAGWRDLTAACQQLASDPGLRTVVLAGRGDTFCAGSDVAEWVDADLKNVDATFDAMEEAMQAVEALPVPVVAAIQGVAAGAGCELALTADVRLATQTARIGMPVARLGILVSPPFAQRLARAVGESVALELLYSGRLLSGTEAERRGLVNRVCTDGDLDGAVRSFLEPLLEQPPAALRAAKQAVLKDRRWPDRPRHSVELPVLHEAVGRFMNRNQRAF